ncbi:MAG: oligosaccharide flippase family protein [Candidatus Bathyarchaeota archaeon]|nr:oligosaccharide flippase family protein [Candidatus Bathyarchaeota archaeon]
MSKAADLAKLSAKGGFNLLWGLVVSTVISAVGTIFIARLLGSDLYGLYAVVLTVPNLVLIFRDWGITAAVVRFTAQYRAEGRLDEIRSVYLSGIIFELILGLVLSVFSFVFADFLATVVFNRPVIAPLIQIASFSIFVSGLVAVATAAFTGYERMELNSIMLIGQSVFKTALIIVLVILGLGTSGATIGFTAGTSIAGLIGLVLIWTIYRRLPKPFSHKLEIKAYLTAMLTYCLPLSFATIITTLLPQFYAFLLPIHYTTDNVMIGNYGVAMNFVVLITFFAQPVITMMFPAFSKLDAEKDKDSLRNVFQYSIKYASLLVVPVAALVMCLAEPAVNTLFGGSYTAAPLFLALLAIQYFYTAFGHLSLAGLLNGQGQTSYVLKLALITGAIGFPMGYLAIMNFGVLGLIATIIVSLVPSLVIGLRFVRKTYGAVVDWLSSAKILFSSAVAASVTYFLVSQLSFTSWIRLVLGVILFIVVLVPAILLTRAISRYDIENLRNMTSSLGIVGRLLSTLLVLLEKIMVIVNL